MSFKSANKGIVSRADDSVSSDCLMSFKSANKEFVSFTDDSVSNFHNHFLEFYLKRTDFML